MKNLINDMLLNNVHIGHKINRLNPSMKNYVLNIKSSVSIINLEKTNKIFLNFLKILENLIKSNKIILFVCTKLKFRKLIEMTAKSINMPYVNKRWFGGTLTNFKVYRKTLNKYNYIKNVILLKKSCIKKRALNVYYKRTKIVEKFLEGTKNLKNLPDAIFVIDSNKHKITIKESNKMKIPTFCIVDTNSSSEKISNVIPGNDDSFKSIIFYLKTISKVIKDNQNLNS